MNSPLPFALAAAVAYAFWLWVEKRRPLRLPTQPKIPRVARNLTIGAIGSAVLRAGFYPSLLALSAASARGGWGLLGWAGLDGPPRWALEFLALDYTLYLWHRVNHGIDFFWRFHNAHHVDLDMDISTGSRFHFGELILSTAVRATEIMVFGISPAVMATYDLTAMVAVHFHHSNVRLPETLERALEILFVTPRMHGIHHSVIERETDSNFSTILSFWDRLHRSFNPGLPPSEITIGVPSYRDPAELTIGKVLLLPFRKQREWRYPDGTVPERRPQDF